MTIEQKEYLREHINDRPRAELARKLNISYNTCCNGFTSSEAR